MSKKLVNHLFVGCGVPLRSMGWLHIEQTIAGVVTHGKVSGVVEPYFMGAGKGTSKEFDDFRLNNCAGVPFHADISEVEAPTEPSIACISTRTLDMPAAFKACVEKGFSHIYLEKPGAGTTADLQEMTAMAKLNGTQVMMGFNKNVCKYVRNALAEAEKVKAAGGTPNVTLLHRNDYTRETIEECFVRNNEGMLRNMAIHELALAVSLFDMNPRTLADVQVDTSGSEKLTLGGYTDFSSLAFKLSNKSGTNLNFKIDRIGGQMGAADVDGTKFVCPDEEDAKNNAVLEAKMPGLVGYFVAQWDDYITLKNVLADHVAAGKPGLPSGVVTLDNAVDCMALCDSLTAEFKAKL